MYFCLPDPIEVSQVTPVTFAHFGLLQALTLFRALSASLSVKLILAGPYKISDKIADFRAISFSWRDSPLVGLASSFTRFLDHTQRHTTVGRTPLDE